MSETLQIIDLKNIDVNTVVDDGIAYVSECNLIPYGNAGKKRLAGTFTYKGAMRGFKSFDDVVVNFCETNDLVGKVVCISGVGSEYNNKVEIQLKCISFNVGSYTERDFIKSVDIQAVFSEFSKFIKTELSPNYYEVMKLVLNVRINQFVTSFAGSKMHDAQVGGLMNHEYKMLKLAKVLVENDARLEPYKDILFVGIGLHDFGKIYEMDRGVYTKNSFVTHRTIGIEILAQEKAKIVELIGETEYYHLLAIIQGHHGEYGDAPTTVWAYLIHLIDMLESQTTGILDSIEAGMTRKSNAGNDTVYVNGSNLVI